MRSLTRAVLSLSLLKRFLHDSGVALDEPLNPRTATIKRHRNATRQRSAIVEPVLDHYGRTPGQTSGDLGPGVSVNAAQAQDRDTFEMRKRCSIDCKNVIWRG